MKRFSGPRLIALAAGAISAGLVLSGCSAFGAGSAHHEGASYRVAYIARAQSDSFADWLAVEMTSEAMTYPDISLDVFSEASDVEQNTTIEKAIAEKYDAIIVEGNHSESQRSYIENIVSAGIVAVTTNPRVADIKGASSIDASPYGEGAAVAKVALEKIPENAKVVVLDGPRGNVHSTERRTAWENEFFAKRPDVKVVAEKIANWNRGEARKLVAGLVIANGTVDAVISMNDDMAAGALEAVADKAEFAGMQAYGADGTFEATLLIKDGKMTATSLHSAGELAKLNMKAVHDLLTGKAKCVNVDIRTPLIDANNAQDYVAMYTIAGLNM
jgi:inositol transport system substrate-binding protein